MRKVSLTSSSLFSIIKVESPDLFEYYTKYAYPDSELVDYGSVNEPIFILKDTHNHLLLYAQNHQVDLQEINRLIIAGYKEGSKVLIDDIRDTQNTHGFNAVKRYLFKLVTELHHCDFERQFYFIKGGLPAHDPQMIERLGFQNALHNEAWKGVFELHESFNNSFKELNNKLWRNRCKELISPRLSKNSF